MIGWFKKRKLRKETDRVEARFQQAVDLFKDLDKREFSRLMDGIKLAWQGYDKIRQVQSVDEKENAEINDAEKALSDYKEV